MLDVVFNEAAPARCVPFDSAASEPSASHKMALLSRQTLALEHIANQLGLLSARVGQAIAIELQPDYEMATRRLLQEAV